MKTKVTFFSFMQSVTDRPDFNPDFQRGKDEGWVEGCNCVSRHWKAFDRQEYEQTIITCAFAVFLFVVLGSVILALHS